MTDEGGYGRFGALSRQELERYCYLDDEDRRLIAARRRDYNRLGFAVQVVTVRHLGMFLADPLDVPPALIEYLAEQLEISDPSMVKRYTDREKTKLEHAWEIQQVYGLKPFGEMESELTSWIVDQAWMTGDGPKAIFGDAVTWLRKRQALLPGITTLERLIGDGRNAADARLWRQLGEQLTSESASALLRLLEVPAEGGQKVSELERLRKGVFKASSKGMLAALRRVVDLQAVGVDSIDVRAIPPRRLTGLATYGLASKAAALRRLPTREQRLAVLAATVVVLSARAVDDVLETFDMLMTTKLLSKAERESREEKLRRYPRVSRNAGKLAAAVKVLLEMVEVNQDVGLGVVLDMIEKTVTRAELRHAVQAVDELVPADDAELDGQRLIELAGKFATVRPFLSMLMDTIEFGATSDGAAVLAAMKTLAELLTSRSSGKIPANLLDARKVDHDLIVGAWKRLIYTPGRPEGTVDRNSYTICVLEQFHRHLKHRSIFAVRSSRWRDPRAHLLAGEAWEAARDAGMNALGLPAAPTQLLTDHATALETAYRELAARLGEDTPASIDADGKLHVAALDAKAEPASLVDLRRRVEAMIPRVDLPELVTEVMSWHPGFTEAFTHTSGNEARVADLGLSVAAVLCSYAMNVGFKPVTMDGPTVGALESGARLQRVTDAVTRLRHDRGVLLVTDLDALLPAEPEPVSTLILDELRRAVDTPGVAFVATTAHPDALDDRTRGQDVCDRELTIPLPDGATRRAVLELMLKRVPTDALDLTEIASRAPGFVAADLAALVREAAIRAASRASSAGSEPRLEQADLLGALEVIRPLSRSGTEELAVGSVTLDDVGDMVETKQALTETVLWPLQHPDSFARLGVDPPRGVLLYGPPGCGKTYLVRALASSGQLSVHAVKGAELMDKWVGASEKAVRELFQRARDSAPSMIFLDEVDALAPRRGQSSDSGVTDRVVAALLTELDGVEPLRDVVVVGATNRPDLIDPALLRPGRLEKLVFVPPPDADARREILRTAGRSVPLADDVDLNALAVDLDGYSAADCSALLREAALAAMRRDVDAADVTAADVAAARQSVRPSLDAAQVAHLQAYADGR